MEYIIIGQAYNSEAEKLKKYLISKKKSFAIISFESFLLAKNMIFYEIFLNGILKENTSFKYLIIKNNHILFIILNFLSLLWSLLIILIFKKKNNFRIAIGVSLFSTLVAFIIKKLSYTKNYVYYSLDYYQSKSKNILLWLYIYIFHKLDILLYKNAIKVWNSSIRLDSVRKKKSLKLNKSVVVTNGFFKDYFEPGIYKYNSKRIVFVGTLSENQALDKLLFLMKSLNTKFKLELDIIGNGPFKQKLKNTTEKLNINKIVKFHGFINSESEMCKIISESVLSYCVYSGDNYDNSLLASPGKLALYNAVGIPSIISDHTFLSKYHKKFNSGIITDSSKDDIEEKISHFMSNDNLRKKMRENLLKIRPIWFTERRYSKAFNSIS